MNVFLFILTNNIAPIFLMIFLGYLMGKRFDLDIFTLSKFNFYIFVPAFTFFQLYTTDIPLDMLKVVLFAVLMLGVNFLVGTLTARFRKQENGMRNAFRNSVMFYNSGNIGIPLITLVFSNDPFIVDGKTPYLSLALTIQVVVLIIQNSTTNTIGFLNADNGKMHWKESVKGILSMPAIYAVTLAFVFKFIPYPLTEIPFWPTIAYAKDGLIAVALLTLGVQLTRTKFNLKNPDVYLSNIIRLIGGPLLAFGLITLFGFQGIMAQTLMISSSVPTAVNTALIAVERKNKADFAAQIVMTSTIFSALTIALTVYFARILFKV
jgi:malate permease and related proteins